MNKKLSVLPVFAFFLVVTNIHAQSVGDFKIDFTEHFDGVKILSYSGSVKAVKIPAVIEGLNVTEISNNAFANRLITSVEVPKTVTTIGNGAFSSCQQLTSITLHDGITSIGENAFRKTAIVSIKIPSKITLISKGMFAECRNLASVEIPEGITVIGVEAFTTCVALAEVKLPTTIRAIHNSAFFSCNLLTSVVIPDSVTNIEFRGNPFVGCGALTMLTQASLRRRGWNPNAKNF